MRTTRKLALAAGLSALALGGIALQTANAADMPAQQGQVQAPGYYPPPPVAYYPPPPVAYYPPRVAYYGPAYAVWPRPYYARWGYWHGYGPRFAYGYGHWGQGWRR